MKKTIILSAFIILYLLCSACHQRDAENEKPAPPRAGAQGKPLDPWVQQQVDWLSEAAEKGKTEKVMAFLDAGVPIDAFNSDGFTALMIACLHGNLQMAKLLIARGADFRLERDEGDDVIASAAFSKNVELMKFFLEKDIDVATVNKRNDTLLYYAAGESSGEMLRLLIANGLKPNAYNCEDYISKRALHRAAGSGLTTVVKILLGENVNINHRDYSLGRTPLMEATVSDRLEIMQLLLDAGADINLQDKNGDTALSMAACNGSPETVGFLLERGADKSIRNKDGMTALQGLKMWRVERYAASYDAVEKLLRAGP